MRGRRSKIGARALLVALLALLPGAARAASIEVTATVSERRVLVGDVVTLEITAVSSSQADIVIDVPDLDLLAEMSRSQSESTSIAWTGGGQSLRRERTLRIELEAQKAGSVTIDSITARSGGDVAKAPPLSIEVVPSGTPEEAVPSPAGEVAPPTSEERTLFVRYRVDRTEAYLGQQILLDLDIFTAGSFNLDEARPPPTLDGFWRETIEQPSQLVRRTERVAGRDYNVYRLWRIAIFPLEAGERVIPSTVLPFSHNRSIFSVGQRLRRTAPPIKVEVLPLPSEGRPRDFAPANVGEYELTATVDAQTVPAGKAVVLKIAVSGAGNVKNLKLPELKAIDGFRVFPPTVKDMVSARDAGILGRKEAEILLMPLRGGRLEIPSLELPIFRPSKKAYERLRTESIRIVVEGEPSAAAAGAVPMPDETAGPAQGGSAGVPRGALRPLRFRSALADRSDPFAASPLFPALLFAPPALFLMVLLGEIALARARRETPASRKKKAAQHARARLAVAEEAVASGAPARAYTEISEVLLAFASEKAGFAIRGLTLSDAKAELLRRGAPRGLVERLIAELERCELARFAPGGTHRASDLDEAIERARGILADLEGWEASS